MVIKNCQVALERGRKLISVTQNAFCYPSLNHQARMAVVYSSRRHFFIMDICKAAIRSLKVKMQNDWRTDNSMTNL